MDCCDLAAELSPPMVQSIRPDCGSHPDIPLKRCFRSLTELDTVAWLNLSRAVGIRFCRVPGRRGGGARTLDGCDVFFCLAAPAPTYRRRGGCTRRRHVRLPSPTFADCCRCGVYPARISIVEVQQYHHRRQQQQQQQQQQHALGGHFSTSSAYMWPRFNFHRQRRQTTFSIFVSVKNSSSVSLSGKMTGFTLRRIREYRTESDKKVSSSIVTKWNSQNFFESTDPIILVEN